MKKTRQNVFVRCFSREHLLRLVLFALLTLPVCGFAQTSRTVQGTVTDVNSEPLAGATVQVKNTQNATMTDVDGNFTLNAPSNAVLVFSYVGYKQLEKNVNNQTRLDVQMEEDESLLQEVVVVGYGTLEKKQVTSSITSISDKQLVQGTGSTSIANSLQGKIAGLVVSPDGGPNSSNSFQLRGVASAKSGQQPLVVIDGMPGGDIRSVLQEDIVSIDVLKDASAGAIYGTRATGGVILITTKKGGDTNGKVNATYTGELTMRQDYNKPRVLTAEEYVEHGRGENFGSSTDWYEELMNDNPISQRHVITLSGGVKNAQIYASLFYGENKGLPINDSRNDYGGRINTNFKLLDGWVDVMMRADYRQTKRRQGRPDFRQALRNNPTRSPYDATSETGYNIWLHDTEDYNVVADANLYKDEGLDQWFKPDFTFKLNVLPIEGLSYQQTLGFERRQWEQHRYRSMKHREEIEKNRRGEAYLGFDKTENVNIEGYMTYIKQFDKHSINAVGGYSYFQHDQEGFNMKNYDFSVDGTEFWNIGEGTQLGKGGTDDNAAKMSSGKSIREKLFALFARANYSYDDKYMAMATIRREGSSKFSDANKWGLFWALSGGWRISNEDFMKDVSFVNDLKLRFGYGVTGNDGFSAEYSKITYGSDQRWPVASQNAYDWLMSYGKSKTPNPDLKWEEKSEWNVGLDFSLFDNRLYGKFDTYKRKIKDMLFEVNAPTPPYADRVIFKNIGSLQNTGWEIEIGADIVRGKDWNYSTNINLSHNTTKLLDLGDISWISSGGLPSPGSPGDVLRVMQNSKVGSFYLYKFAGFDENGQFLLYNKAGEAVIPDDIRQEDKQHIGNFNPALVVGWNHTLSYKNWDMTVNLRSWIDFDVFNAIDMYYALPNDGQKTNLLKKAYDKNAHIKGEKQLCDYFLEDGTFLKIDAINIGYNLDLKKYTKNLFNRARFYLTMTNVATITGYSGINPEVNINGVENNGIEWLGFYPQTRSYILGVQLSF
ncbi:SusC/RagA family TonB-linked outer membrane protein [Prevotella sp. 10(H)]|uniref:SusC/RagA family TonB-linked outer membrane protein n=1 Tax=Prevotella sp. 10(H) TaxID=1158294 RepID=UPI0009DFAA9A|nr:SusC/RagA family TonB-linked outer membrane protein [Prevotella sp. 10(H)]